MRRRDGVSVRGSLRLAACITGGLWAMPAAMSGGVGSAVAQVLAERYIDIASVPCRELLQMPLPQALVLVGWLGGYVAGLRDENRVDRNKFIDGTDRVLTRCRENESLPLIEVAKQELGSP